MCQIIALLIIPLSLQGPNCIKVALTDYVRVDWNVFFGIKLDSYSNANMGKLFLVLFVCLLFVCSTPPLSDKTLMQRHFQMTNSTNWYGSHVS